MVCAMTQASAVQPWPDGMYLAYTICHEDLSWLRAPYNQRPNKGNRAVQVALECDDDEQGRCVWEFYLVEQILLDKPVLMVSLFPEAWPAFRQIPRFFAALAAGGETLTLDGVVALLEQDGAVDETQRSTLRPARVPAAGSRY